MNAQEIGTRRFWSALPATALALALAGCGVEGDAGLEDIDVQRSPALYNSGNLKWPRTCTNFNDSRCPIQANVYINPSVSAEVAFQIRAGLSPWNVASGGRITFVEKTTLDLTKPNIQFSNRAMSPAAGGFCDHLGPNVPNVFSGTSAPVGISIRSHVPVGMDILHTTANPEGAIMIMTADGELKSRSLNGLGPLDPADPTHTKRLPWTWPNGQQTPATGTRAPDQIVDFGFDGGTVITWWKDGRRTKGSVLDLLSSSNAAYTTGPYGIWQNLGIAVYNSRVYSWWNDNGTVKRMVGSSTRLDSITGPTTVTLLPGRTATDVNAVGIDSENGVVRTLWADGTFSMGDTLNLGSQGGNGFPAIGMKDGPLWGTVVHELGHALGLAHEQLREGRDFYLKVGSNVVNGPLGPDMAGILPGSQGWVKVGGYDFASVMHYGANYVPASVNDYFTRWDTSYFSTQGVAPSYQDVMGVLTAHGFITSAVDLATRPLTSQDATLPTAYSMADGMAVISSTRDTRGTATPADDIHTFKYDLAGLDWDNLGRVVSFYNQKPRSDSATNKNVAFGHRLDLGVYGTGTYQLPPGVTESQLMAVAVAKSNNAVSSYFKMAADAPFNCRVKVARGALNAGGVTRLDSLSALACLTDNLGRAWQIVDVASDLVGGVDTYYFLYNDGFMSRSTSFSSMGTGVKFYQDKTGLNGFNLPNISYGAIGFAVRLGAAYFYDQWSRVKVDTTFGSFVF